MPETEMTSASEKLRISVGLWQLQKARKLVCWIEADKVYVARRVDFSGGGARKQISWEGAAIIVAAGRYEEVLSYPRVLTSAQPGQRAMLLTKRPKR